MSVEVSGIVWQARHLSPPEKMVLLRLADFADDSGQRVFPSVPRIAADTNLDVRTVQRLLRRLEGGKAHAKDRRPTLPAILKVVADADAGRKRPKEYRFDLAKLRRLAERGGTAPPVDDIRPPAQDHLTPGTAPSVPPAHDPFTPGTTPPLTVKEPSRESVREPSLSAADAASGGGAEPPAASLFGDVGQPTTSDAEIPASAAAEIHAPDPERAEPEQETAEQTARSRLKPSRAARAQPAESDNCDSAFAEWNTTAVTLGLPQAQDFSNARRKALAARLREIGGLKAWRAVLAQVRASAFLRGESGRDNWRGATLDFLLKPSNLAKVREGNYADKRGGPATAKPGGIADYYRHRRVGDDLVDNDGGPVIDGEASEVAA